MSSGILKHETVDASTFGIVKNEKGLDSIERSLRELAGSIITYLKLRFITLVPYRVGKLDGLFKNFDVYTFP